MFHVAESTKSVCAWERRLLEFALRQHRDGRVTSYPWVRANNSFSSRTPLFCCKSDLLQCIWLETEHTPLRERRMWESLACPTHSASLHTWQCCLPVHNQVKLLKVPTALSSRLGGHILFRTSVIIWPTSLSPPLPGGHYRTYRSPYLIHPASFEW